jgi:hypothetical protein
MLRHAVPLRRLPRHWRPLVASYAVATTLLTLLTVLTLATGRRGLFEALYGVALPAVLFCSPAIAGAVSAALGGGLLPTLALGSVPSLAWGLTVLVGTTARTLLGGPVSAADSPLWAIVLAFLVIGVCLALAGFFVGRAALLTRRRLPV